jgi:hypothetical protein
MLGAGGDTSGFLCVRKGSRRETDGGGDLSRGDIGQEGVESPDTLTLARCDRWGSLDIVSETVVGCSWGAVAVERARCIAAAEGTLVVWPVMLGGL